MGTSKGYDMPTGGNWTPLKTEATKFVKKTGKGSVSPKKLVANYLKTIGGARSLAHSGAGGGGSGSNKRRGSSGSSRGGRAASSVGRALGGFLSSVSSVGLDKTLRDFGLKDLIGRSAEEVTAGLLDVLAAPGSTLDEHAARLALAKINDDLLKDAKTYEDIELALTKSLNGQGLYLILSSFFGYYVYERFCRDFYENWAGKVGSSQAARSLKSIKDYIKSRIKAKLTGCDVKSINWSGRSGLRLSEQVMQDTLEVFEVTT